MKELTKGKPLTRTLGSARGFTIIEMAVSIAITSIIVIVIYTAYTTQQGVYQAQEQIAELQQNLRAATDIISREIRLAGYDPEYDGGSPEDAGLGVASIDNTGKFEVTVSGSGSIEKSDGTLALGEFNFTYIDDDGDPVGISFMLADEDAKTGDNSGDLGNNVNYLGMKTDNNVGVASADYVPIAENIQRLEFLCFDKDGDIIVAPANIHDVRSVRVTILARAGEPSRKFKNTTTYQSPGGQVWGPFDDNYRRRMLTTTVQLRNVQVTDWLNEKNS